MSQTTLDKILLYGIPDLAYYKVIFPEVLYWSTPQIIEHMIYTIATKKIFIYFYVTERNKYLFCPMDNKVEFKDFPWGGYLRLNPGLKSNIDTKILAWKHWEMSGRKEERGYSQINNSYIHKARFGNLFFINCFLHFASLKFDLESSYKQELQFNKLGIRFHHGKQTHRRNVLITPKNFMHVLREDTDNILKSNVIITNDVWFQKAEFVVKLYNLFNQPNIKKTIIDHNLFGYRYNNNNDVFIHVRLGDIQHITQNMKSYYDKALSSITFSNGYIATDTFDHPLCVYLTQKYKLIHVDVDEVNTIMFGNTCKHLVLCGGTFSWMIGFFGYFSSTILYPKIKNPWYGDIFGLPTWKCLNLL